MTADGRTLQERFSDLALRAGLAGVPAKVTSAALVLSVLAGAWGVTRLWPKASVDETWGAPSPQVAREATPAAIAQPAAEPTGSVVVHVAGAVRRPGVYTLPATARVAEAVDAAGGTLGSADTAAVNLARRLADGEQIYLPKEGEAPRGAAGGAAGPASGAGAAGPAATGTGAPVDLNTATAEQLDTLPGVGPATAQRIIADRTSNGPFGSIDDLARVPGIGQKRLETLRPLVCVQ